MKREVALYKPLPYQIPIIAALTDPAMIGIKYITANLSRRIGKSLTAKNVVLFWMLSVPKTTVGYVTPTSDLSRKFLREIVKNLKGSDLVANSNASDLFIEFANGSIIFFMSAEAGDGNRGNGFDYLVYDEAAFIDEDTYSEVFKPMELQAKKVFAISTPNGAAGFFFNLFTKGMSKENPRFASFKTTLTESRLYDKETINEIKEDTPKAIYSQEFDCEFISGGLSAFGDINPFLGRLRTDAPKRLYAGLDFSGDGGDKTVLTITNEFCETVSVHTWDVGNVASITAISSILKDKNVHVCVAETNSMGSISIDLLKKEFPRVVSIFTSNTTKRDYVENVIVNFQKNIGGIENSPMCSLQFNNFVMKLTPKTKKVTYGAITDNLHDDYVISYCLACWGVKKNATMGEYCLY